MSNYPTEAAYDLYVPRSDEQVARGTPLVARAPQEGWIHAHYEEPANYANIKTFADRIVHAAGRLHDRYPTSKMQGFRVEDVIHVGKVGHRAGRSWVIVEITNLNALMQWDEGPHYIGGSPKARYDRDSLNTLRSLGS